MSDGLFWSLVAVSLVALGYFCVRHLKSSVAEWEKEMKRNGWI